MNMAYPGAAMSQCKLTRARTTPDVARSLLKPTA